MPTPPRVPPQSNSRALLPHLFRQSREVARLTAATELATLEVGAAAVIEQVRLDAIDAVASRAMQGVSLVTQLEGQLAQAVPLAASRLQAIGDMHALTVAGEVASLSRRLPQ